METEWDYSGRKGRDGQKKKIGKANKRKGKVQRGKDEEVNGQGGRGVPRPHTGSTHGDTVDIAKYLVIIDNKVTTSGLNWRAVVKIPICHLLHGTSHVATTANTNKQHKLHNVIHTKLQLIKMNEMKVQ